MPDWLKTVIYCFAGVGFWTVSASIALWFRDRSGNSGRQSHWKDNPRIKSPDDVLSEFAAKQEPLGPECQKVLDDNWWELITDKDHEALGAMLHAMRPRDDRRDEDGQAMQTETER